jgi:hypothetical protein
MDETTSVELTHKQQLTDQVAVTVLAGLAGLLTTKGVEKGYKFVMAAYRLRKAAA